MDEQAKVPADNQAGAKKRIAAKPAVAGDAPPAVAVAKAVDAPIGASAAAGSAVLPLHTQTQDFDREIRAAVGRATGSLSVASALLAGIDWAVNLLVSLGKRAELQLLALKQAHQLANYAVECALAGPSLSNRCVTPPARDRRFDDEAWLHWPFNMLHQSFLMTEQWWAEATRGVAGVDRHHEDLLSFIVRQLLDVTSPGNSLWTNPVALKATLDEGGLNLVRGVARWRTGARSPAPCSTDRSRPDDGVRIVRAFQALEPRSIYLRFFSPKRELNAEEVRRVTEPDPAREAALVATVATGDQEEIIVGLGEYVGSGASAHVAFAVEEDYQGRGIASRMFEHLARIAREKGISRFEADVLAGNTPMLKVLRHSGLPMTESEQDGVVHVTLTLGDGTA